MKIKKLISGVIAGTVIAGSVFTVSPPKLTEKVTAESNHNYAEALQKSLFFYECQQAGPLPEWNRVEWRADSTMNDFIKGGWYDAGDHVKFNLPMAYSASMVAWGLYQYPDGIKKCGEMENYVNNLTFVMDYLAACDLGDEVVYQVGNGQEDHTWWGPVELYEYGMEENGKTEYFKGRPYYTADASGGYSAVLGEMAAALAAGACALDGKSSKTDDYIKHAENIFKIADASKSDEDYNNSDAGGFYQSHHFYDELFYAANWLYKATGKQEYINKAESYIPNLGKELGSDELKYSWAQCWDDVMQGGMLLYAQNTGKNVDRVKKHLDYLTDSANKLEGGLVYLDTWGCLRYAASAGFITAVACDTLSFTDQKYKDFYETQINYCLGDNPNNRSYVVGYGKDSPLNVHHRTAHGSWKNAVETPDDNRHILYGALAGGPSQDGSYEDDRGNHINNEVACDYNAGFTGLLCKMVDEYGGDTDPSFPEPEKRDDEFYVEAAVKQSSPSGVSLSLKMTNHTAWPARVENNFSYRYYFDASEVINAGFKAEDIVVRVDRDQAKMYGEEYAAEVSPITQYKGNVYYIEVKYPNGAAILPISEGRNQCETMLALVFPNYGTGWDASNDYSNTDILDSEESVITDKIPVYLNGRLVYGTEPDGTKPSEPDNPSIGKGDINADGMVNLRDWAYLNKFLTKQTTLNKQQMKLADCNVDGKINIFDSMLIWRHYKRVSAGEEGLL